MTTENEQPQEQPQVIVINTKEHVKTLIEAGSLAEKTTRYDRMKHGVLIFFNQGNNQTTNPTLAEYLSRAEKKIVKDMMPEIINEAKTMINDELTTIKELLK